MQNRWSAADAASLTGLDLLIYASRLMGQDGSLVVWGGGNSSLKHVETDFRGRETPVMRVKGSGSDMKAVVARDFPGVRIDDVLPLLEREALDDDAMVAYLARTLMEPDSARPSIETLLHTWIPRAFVLHSHADAILSLTNVRSGDLHVRRCFGDEVAVVPYHRPGFALAKQVALAYRATSHVRGVILMNHGLITWSDDAKEAYDTHIEFVSRAEAYCNLPPRPPSLAGKGAPRATVGGQPDRLSEHGTIRPPKPAEGSPFPAREGGRGVRSVAARVAPVLRRAVSGRQRAVLRFDDGPDLLDFLASERGQALSQIGAATPDHLLNTKRLPCWVEIDDPDDADAVADAVRAAVARYAERYAHFVERHNREGYPLLDPYPRVILVPGIGMWSAGRDYRGALVPGNIYHHTIAVMRGAEQIDHYASLSDEDAFDAEYWPLELYKLTLLPPEQELARRIALVTGGGRGIGRAIAERLARAGAHVVVTDINADAAEAVAADLCASVAAGRAVGRRLDVTDAADVEAAFDAAALVYGGVDIVVSNAGIAESAPIEAITPEGWRHSLEVNATGHFLVAQAALRLMRRQDLGGSLIFNASKNVTSPGRDFAAYSAAKAAEAQLARIVAIEGAEIGVRANVLNPDAVFEGSGLFSDELRASRARAHGVAPEDLEAFYQTRNLLKVRVLAEDVAEAALFLASDRSAKTTGAMLPVDGGLRDAFVR